MPLQSSISVFINKSVDSPIFYHLCLTWLLNKSIFFVLKSLTISHYAINWLRFFQDYFLLWIRNKLITFSKELYFLLPFFEFRLYYGVCTAKLHYLMQEAKQCQIRLPYSRLVAATFLSYFDP